MALFFIKVDKDKNNKKMRKINLVILVSLFLIFGTVIHARMLKIPALVEPSSQEVSVANIAVDKSPVLKFLEPGTLEKIIFIHYADGKVKITKSHNAVCYKLMGVKWGSLPIKYVVHPALEAIVPGAIFMSNEEWDRVTSKELFENDYSIDETANWDVDAPDGRNEYSLGNYPEEGVIAISVVWSGIPRGTKGRQIIEYDVMFDTDFKWGDATQDLTVMDLQNIATHESGHGLGLDDVYNTACSEVTMYGYSTYGETIKRTLESPDIIALQKLYGK